MNTRFQKGFTLVELVVVIIVSGILSGVLMAIVVQPMQAYDRLAKRARMVDVAETALHHMTIEVQVALPNSIQTCADGSCVEFLRTVAGAKYTTLNEDPVPDDDEYSLSVEGIALTAEELSLVDDGADADGHCNTGESDCLVVYNLGSPGANAWDLDNMRSITYADAASVSYREANPAGENGFPTNSPENRFFVVDRPVRFKCANNQIKRVEGYDISSSYLNDSNNESSETLTGGNKTESLLAKFVYDCSFQYIQGSATEKDVLLASITISDLAGASDDEFVTLLHQIHVSNLP